MSGGDRIAGSGYAEALLAVIGAPDHAAKARLLDRMPPPEGGWAVPALPAEPGRPPGLRQLDDPPRRRAGLGDPRGRLRFLHSLWHIELSAVDLACAASLRGPGQPAEFHADMLDIARDEARHAGLVDGLLRARGFPPGSDPVHHRLWRTALRCADLGEHLVAVPRVLEARGLDVNAAIIPRLAGDAPMQEVLRTIYVDEVRHVALGTRWHRDWCRRQGCDAEAHFRAAAARVVGDPRSPFALDREGRRRAGFTEGELDWLAAPPLSASPAPSAIAGR